MDEKFNIEMMKRVIDLSKQAVREPEKYQPFAGIIVRNEDRKIIAEGCNDMQEKMDPSRHGEVVAISNACKAIGSMDLTGHTLYTSCEPCAMCTSLIWMVNFDKVFYGNSDWELIFDVKEQVKVVATPAQMRNNYEQLLENQANDVIKQWSKKAINSNCKTGI